ncbi:cellulose biosynthesis protein BcsQ [Pararobbsia silviterrae]|uniref:Cellulose synthase operon protein YhjQ n=1 Tax=Pararobbsia silviterrae TaxID=1792498 RepID=A0A494XAI6_9BURK|nr:cellulose biosynthesis protein BcsQ [Pararobbsia silviterrae]RKP47765.1 cellulose synthase operon protein YhjQ [Pararobbsia silviterrae]
MRTIAIVSAKGGVGKTTVCASLASLLAEQGRRVIVLDLDPQNALRFHFGIPLELIDGISRATLAGERWVTALQNGSGDVGVLPYGALNEDDRATFERVVDDDPAWLRNGLEALHLGEDDLLMIDTPPGPTIYLKAALSYCDFAVNVVLADAASYATIPVMDRLVATYALPRAGFRGVGYVMNQVDQGRQLTKDVVRVLRNVLGHQVYPGLIHLDQGVSEALAYDTTVNRYDPHCQATQDLKGCAQWLMQTFEAAARPDAREAVNRA